MEHFTWLFNIVLVVTNDTVGKVVCVQFWLEILYKRWTKDCLGIMLSDKIVVVGDFVVD